MCVSPVQVASVVHHMFISFIPQADTLRTKTGERVVFCWKQSSILVLDLCGVLDVSWILFVWCDVSLDSALMVGWAWTSMKAWMDEVTFILFFSSCMCVFFWKVLGDWLVFIVDFECTFFVWAYRLFLIQNSSHLWWTGSWGNGACLNEMIRLVYINAGLVVIIFFSLSDFGTVITRPGKRKMKSGKSSFLFWVSEW